MSLAIGLGGFMDGFTGGMRARDAMDDRKRSKVIQERQDVEYNRSLDQRNAVDQINKDARSTFDAQVTAGTQKPDNFDQFWNSYAVPKLKNTYLVNGDMDNAKRVQDWGDSEDAKNGAKLFSGALVKAQTGDSAGALADVIQAGKIKGYINNGYEVLGQEPILTPDGKSRGFRISLKMPDGKEVQQDIQTADLPKLIATFGNPEAAWNSQIASRAAAEKEAGELKQYEEKKKIDKQYGVGDTKQRGDAITSLRKRLDGGLAGDEKKFDDLSAEEKERLIGDELELIRGQPGVAGQAAPSRPEKKVLVDTVTGKQVQSSSPSPAPSPPERRQKDDNARAPTPREAPMPGVPARAQAGVRSRIEDLKRRSTAEAPGVAAPSQEQAVSKANAALEGGASAEEVATGLHEAGVPEWQWPRVVQEALRARQQSYGLNP
ncbi:hypothetical protein GGQ73_003021 [Rhizobium skierniewicense]|uniref:Uncharacterized protein n=1 Tax=Rhizobium skierniewicense TaxID=984260 RepID=A0A7W6CC19_9HYPH|nr:hypothetical protein [Rhizobium skierniewicense]MBB3947057.1 hypothetical protein [Rhizobium skierniewicense]